MTRSLPRCFSVGSHTAFPIVGPPGFTAHASPNRSAQKRATAKRLKLRWRVSHGARRSLGWLPFKAANLKRKGRALRFCGKTFRVFERERLDGVTWKQGCFAQDAVGDWWLCLPVEQSAEPVVAPKEAVGIDLGIKDAAVTSDGERLEGPLRFYRDAQGSWGCCKDAGIYARPNACTVGFAWSTPGCLPPVQQKDSEYVSDDYRRRCEQPETGQDTDGEIGVGFRLGPAQDATAVQGPAGRQACRSRQREKHHARLLFQP